MKRLTHLKESQIINDLLSRRSTRIAAQRQGVSQSTVSKYAKAHKENIPPQRAGRPSKISDQTKRKMVRDITNGTLNTAVDVQTMLEQDYSIRISAARVRQILRNEGLTGKRKVPKPKLTPHQRAERMDFVMKYQYWTIDDWRRVIWSDETKVNRVGSDGALWSWVKENMTNVQDQAVRERLKFGGGSIMMWGCMTWYGPGFICEIEGVMDGSLYVEILEDCLPRTQRWYGIKTKDMIFQQDNDPKHTSRAAKKYFVDHKIRRLFWPPNSPDLNPIEHLWAYVKRQLGKYPKPAKGIDELWKRIQEVWNAIPASLCQSLIESMPRRIQAVKKAKGGYTRY